MKCLAALIVGCSKDIRAAIARMLAPYGFDCIAVRDANAALKFAAGDAIDLFVIDVDAPELGGRELLQLIRHGRFGANPPPAILYSARPAADAVGFGVEGDGGAGPIVVNSPLALGAAVDRAFPGC